MNIKDEIQRECAELCTFLIEKNEKYGNSALDFVNIFSEANATDAIRIRIDDKLKRMKANHAKDDEDVVKDLIGYLILLRIAERQEEIIRLNNQKCAEIARAESKVLVPPILDQKTETAIFLDELPEEIVEQINKWRKFPREDSETLQWEKEAVVPSVTRNQLEEHRLDEIREFRTRR